MAFPKATQNGSLDAVEYNGQLLWEYKGGTWQPRWLDAAAIVASPKWIIEWQGENSGRLWLIICHCRTTLSDYDGGEIISFCAVESKIGGGKWCGIAAGIGRKPSSCLGVRRCK